MTGNVYFFYSSSLITLSYEFKVYRAGYQLKIFKFTNIQMLLLMLHKTILC